MGEVQKGRGEHKGEGAGHVRPQLAINEIVCSTDKLLNALSSLERVILVTVKFIGNQRKDILDSTGMDVGLISA